MKDKFPQLTVPFYNTSNSRAFLFFAFQTANDYSQEFLESLLYIFLALRDITSLRKLRP